MHIKARFLAFDIVHRLHKLVMSSNIFSMSGTVEKVGELVYIKFRLHYDDLDMS